MRWMISCTVWVTIAAVITASKEDDTRPKRDISLIKNFITTKLFGGEALQAPVAPNYRLFRIPGFDNILVKAVPKVNVLVGENPLAVEHKLEDYPALALVSSYLGTNSLNETNTALERVKILLKSGVLNAQEEEADIPYHVPIDIPPMTETVQVIPKNNILEVPSIQYRVPIPYMPVVQNLYKSVQIPLPELAYPTKYSYKQLHHDGVTSYSSNDAKNVVVTESKVPVQLPHYLSGRFQEVLALGINRVPLTPMSVVQPLPYKSYNIPANHYVPIRISPAFIEDNYSHNLHQDGIVSSTGVNYVPTNYSYKHLHQDGSTSTYAESGERIETPGFQHPYVVNIYEPPKVMATPYIPMKAAPTLVPTGYSYKHLHNDGTVTSYSGAGVVENINERPAVVVDKVKRPIPLPAFFANRIENVAATAHKLSSPAAIKDTVYGPPISVYQEAIPFIPTNVTPAIVPTNYSYKHIHNDGTVTAYIGADVVEKVVRPTVVVGEVKRPILPPSYFTNGNKNTATTYKLPPFIGEPAYGPPVSVYQGPAPFVATPFTPEVGPTGYSYKHIHNDGTVTAYSGAGVVEGRPGILVQEVRRPIPLPRFFANRIETVAATAHKLPQAIIEQPAVYYPALPVHQDTYPILLEHLRGSFPKPLNPHFNDEVKINFTGHNVQTGYSYQTVHQSGPSTSHYTSKPVQENNEFHKEKSMESNEESNTETYGKGDTQSGEFSYNTVHSDDGSITSQVLVPKPIISQYSYKQINHHMPNVPFKVVKVGDEDIELEQLKAQLDRAKVTKGKSENSVPEINNDYIFVPPTAATGPNINNKAVDLKPEKPPKRETSEENSDISKDVFHTTEAVVSSSAISLSANPIVVPEDSIYSYKQHKAGSSITVKADKTNKVSVVEENKMDNLESHRGDIPDISF